MNAWFEDRKHYPEGHPRTRYGYLYEKALNISDLTMRDLKREAARRRLTMSELGAARPKLEGLPARLRA